MPAEPNGGRQPARSLSAEQRAAEREIHAGAQDSGVRVAGLTEVGEYETTFAGKKDAPVEIGGRMTITLRVAEDGSLLPRRENSDASTPAATSILEIEVTPSVEYDSRGQAHVVWNGYASQSDVATGIIIATSLSGPTTAQEQALQGDRSATDYGNDPVYKDAMLGHMAGSRAEAVTQALSPLVSGGKMNVGRLEPVPVAESGTVQDPDTPTETHEPIAEAEPTETHEPDVEAAPTEPAEPAVTSRTDFSKWVKLGTAMVATAGVVVGGTFLFTRGDSPETDVTADSSAASPELDADQVVDDLPVEELALEPDQDTQDDSDDETSADNAEQSATPPVESEQAVEPAEPAAPPPSEEAIPNGWDEVDDHGDSGLPPDPGGEGADVRQYDYWIGSHVFTMTVEGDGEAMSTADTTKWYNPRFIVNNDPSTNFFDDESGFMIDVKWGSDGGLEAIAFDAGSNIIDDAVIEVMWLDSSTLQVTVDIPGTQMIVTRTRVELSVRTRDSEGNTVSTFGDDAFWAADA